MSLHKILFLAANPTDSSRLRRDEELREIREGLRRAEQRDRFKLSQRWAVMPRTLQRAILEEKPQIVHFSGHGGGEGLFFEDRKGQAVLVKTDALAGLFRLFAQYVPHVIGLRQAVGDRAAIEFALGFYDALGVGETVAFAFESRIFLFHSAVFLRSLNSPPQQLQRR